MHQNPYASLGLPWAFPHGVDGAFTVSGTPLLAVITGRDSMVYFLAVPCSLNSFQATTGRWVKHTHCGGQITQTPWVAISMGPDLMALANSSVIHVFAGPGQRWTLKWRVGISLADRFPMCCMVFSGDGQELVVSQPYKSARVFAMATGAVVSVPSLRAINGWRMLLAPLPDRTSWVSGTAVRTTSLVRLGPALKYGHHDSAAAPAIPFSYSGITQLTTHERVGVFARTQRSDQPQLHLLTTKPLLYRWLYSSRRRVAWLQAC